MVGQDDAAQKGTPHDELDPAGARSAGDVSASETMASETMASETMASEAMASEAMASDAPPTGIPDGEILLGIDLGTTNSVVAILRGNQPFVIPVEGDAGTLPSAVGFDANNQLLVGTPARNQALLGPEKTILSVKRRMGEDVRLQLGDEQMSPQEVSAVILRTLKQRAEAYLGRAVSKAVITVPAFFKDSQRQATREAGELAGLEVVRIINEPTAAALTYESESGERRRLLVYDLGGGTFDVSIVQIEEGVVEVLSSHGDTRLGGDDFDKLLVDFVADKFAAEHGVDLRDSPTAHSRLRHAAEEAKKRLSFEVFTTIDEAFIAESNGAPLSLSMTIERADYEDLIGPLVEKTIASVDQALEDAKLFAKQIDTVILVGGSTRTPLVQRVVEEKLGQQPLSHVDPDLCVAMGAAIQGGLIQGLDVGPVLVDITPHTLGVRCISYRDGFFTDRYFQEIIARNTALPAARSEIFFTHHPGQEVALFDIYQGEHKDATLNEFVGVLRLEGLDTSAEDNSELLVKFGLNVNGTLSATAIERATSLEKSVTIDNVITRFRADSREEAKQRLARMFRDDAEPASAGGVAAETAAAPVSTSRSSVVFQHARQLLSRAERQMPDATETDRQEISAIVKRLRQAMEKDDVEATSAAVEQLDDILFYLQDA